MKKLFLLSIGSVFCLQGMAQTEKGAKLVGASIGNLSYGYDDDVSSLSVQLFPKAGLF